MLVRAVMSDGNYTDLEFETLPRESEVILMPVQADEYEAWIVTAVGHRFADLTKAAMPVIELERYEEDVPPPGRFDRMAGGR